MIAVTTHRGVKKRQKFKVPQNSPNSPFSKG